MTQSTSPLKNAISFFVASLLLAETAVADDPPTLQWIHQTGLPRYDDFNRVALDRSGNVYASGSRSGPADGQFLKIEVVQRFDLEGNSLWTREIGTSVQDDDIYGLWAGDQGSLFVAGITPGNVGGPNLGYDDGYLRKYDQQGNVSWTRQVGTTSSDTFLSLTGDGLGSLYVAGGTGGNLAGDNQGGMPPMDAIVGKYDATGNLLWMRQFGGTGFEQVQTVVPDRLGNILIAGNTDGDLGGVSTGEGPNVLGKFNGAGDLLWLRQYGASERLSTRFSTDAVGNMYFVVGANLNGGDRPVSLSKYDAEGTHVWTRELENRVALAAGLFVDDAGNVYLSGVTTYTPTVLPDAFALKYNTQGELLWTYDFSSAGHDGSYSIAADGRGNVLLGGDTFGSLGIPNPAGFFDGWIALLRESIPGDFNDDGLVDGADLSQWRGDFSLHADSDADHDGDSDGADFLVWQRQLSAVSADSFSAVPEPGAWALSIVGLAAAGFIRRCSGIPVWKS